MKRIIKIALLVTFVSVVVPWTYLMVISNQTVLLPKPSGTYYVGRTVFDWIDTNRTNTFVDKPSENRELMVMVWYPTDVSNGETVPYIPEPWLSIAEKDQSGLGALLTHRLTNIRTHSYADAVIAKGDKAFPLVILEPGLGRASYDYSSYAENLASNGYIVISSSPTFLTDLVVFNDRRSIPASAKLALPEHSSAIAPDTLATLSQIEEIYVGDINYLIDQSFKLNTDSNSVFFSRIDTSKIGVIGHSIGGAAAYHICLSDYRCKVAVDIDGTLYGETQSVNIVPFMFMGSDTSKHTGDVKEDDEYNDKILAKQTQPFTRITIPNSAHFNFSDLAVRSPLFRLFGALGSINGVEGLNISSKYLVDTLDNYLKK